MSNELPKQNRSRKEVPEEIHTQLAKWRKQAALLRGLHVLLGVTVITASVTVASRLFDPGSLLMAGLALSAAVSSGLLTSLGLEQKSNNMRNAWRTLNAAILRFDAEPSYGIEKVLVAYEQGEHLIGDVKLSLSSK